MLPNLFVAIVSLAVAGLHDPSSITQLTTGYQFTEGPLYLPNGTLLFTDIPASRICTGSGGVYREPSHQANGLTLDSEGRLIAAEHETRRVTRTEKDGQVTVLAERFDGKRFNSPNDVVVRSGGMVYFTDPPYGLPGGMEKSELGFSGVYAINTKSGSVALISKQFSRPNGLCLSPDEKTLYVADTEGEPDSDGIKGDIWRFTLDETGSSTAAQRFCRVPFPDGIKADTAGNIWATCRAGVQVFSPDGALLETVAVPEEPANCAFGGPDGKTLYITARTSVFTVRTTVQGLYPGNQVSTDKPG